MLPPFDGFDIATRHGDVPLPLETIEDRLWEMFSQEILTMREDRFSLDADDYATAMRHAAEAVAQYLRLAGPLGMEKTTLNAVLLTGK